VINRKPERFHTKAPGAYLAMQRDRGTVTVWALGGDRFRVQAPSVSHEIDGFPAARDLAKRLAAELGSAVAGSSATLR
jgi:hypothetical protein